MKKRFLLFLMVLALLPAIASAGTVGISNTVTLHAPGLGNKVVVTAQVHSLTPPVLTAVNAVGDVGTGNWGLESFECYATRDDMFVTCVVFASDLGVMPGQWVHTGFLLNATDSLEISDVTLCVLSEPVPLEDMFSTGYAVDPTMQPPVQIEVLADGDTIVERLACCVLSEPVPLEDMFSTGLGEVETGPSPGYPMAVWEMVMVDTFVPAHGSMPAAYNLMPLMPGEVLIMRGRNQGDIKTWAMFQN